MNALEEQLNIDNQNIRESFENFMEARALVREARSQYFPTVSVGAFLHALAGSRTLTSGAIVQQRKRASSHRCLSLPGEVSWEPDLWGKVRNTVRCQPISRRR